MADIFGGVEPPAWLQRLTATQPGELGQIFGELVGGLADASETAIDTATKKQAQGINTSWIKELPASIKPGLVEARLNVQNPLWRMQAQQAQLNMAQQAISIQNQQSMIESRAQKLRMQQHDQDVLPKWLLDHPTWESRQDAEPPQLMTTEGQRMFRDVQLGDAANVKHKAIIEGINSYAKGINDLLKLDPQAAAPFAAQIGKVPTPQMTDALGSALSAAQEKAKKALEPVPMEIEVGGRKIQGYMQGKTFTELKPSKPAAQPKISAALQSELTLGRERILGIERAMADPANTANKDKMTELRKQQKAAQDYYYSVLTEARNVQGATPTEESATPSTDDPLNLGIGK